MIIVNSKFDFYRNVNGYFVFNRHVSLDMSYKLYTITNNNKALIETVNIPPKTTITVNFPSQAFYQIDVIPAILSGPDEKYIYDIPYFPSVKEGILTSMVDTICDCNNLDSVICITTAISPTVQDVYDLELLYNGVETYISLYTAAQFLRDGNCCVNSLMGFYNKQISNDMLSAINEMQLQGNATSSMTAVRIITALKYIIYYIIELDVSKYYTVGGILSDNPPSYYGNTEEQDSIKAIFDTDRVRACVSDIGLDFDYLYDVFSSCYSNKDYSECYIQIIDPNASIGEFQITSTPTIADGEVIEAGTAHTVTQFDWANTGTPVNLTLRDNTRLLGEIDVSGLETYATSTVYDFSAAQKVIWSLNGDNVDELTIEAVWVNPLYYDYTATDVNPLEAEILSTGTKLVEDYINTPEPTYPTYDAVTGRFWYYVFPADQGIFTHWEMNGNTKAILSLQIASVLDIFNAGTVVVNSITYNLYRSTGEMVMTHDIKFKYSA